MPFVTAVNMIERSLAVCGDPLFSTLLYDYLLADVQSVGALDDGKDMGQESVGEHEEGQEQGQERGWRMGRGRIDAFLALQPCPQAEEYLRGKDPCILHRHVRLC